MNRRKWSLSLLILAIALLSRQVDGAPAATAGAGRVIGVEDAAGILERQVEQMLGDAAKRVEVSEIRGYEPMTLPPGDFYSEVSFPDQAMRGGTHSGSIRFIVNGREIKKVRVTARIRIIAEVVIARSYLKKHQLLQEKDLMRSHKDISLLPPDVVTDPDQLIAKRTTLAVNGHEVFRRGMVERAPLVKKGDRITLVVDNPFFRIMSVGEVQEEGGRGERVRMVNVSSKKEVYGRVLDANTAQIDY
jgi:flagellar basal body P-ring formation protein FlgA